VVDAEEHPSSVTRSMSDGRNSVRRGTTGLDMAAQEEYQEQVLWGLTSLTN
jgi:hypothetical protein